jgi:hypothetical protein
MSLTWILYWIFVGIFVLGDTGWMIWAMNQGTGQAMPPTILPLIVGILGVGFFVVVAVIIIGVRALLGP